MNISEAARQLGRKGGRALKDWVDKNDPDHFKKIGKLGGRPPKLTIDKVNA